MLVKKLNLEKRTFAITFFRCFTFKSSEGNGINSVILIGDKVNNKVGVYSSYHHITKSSASAIFTNETMHDIIEVLISKGEKSILQLSLIMPYEKENITKYVKKLRDERIIKYSRKEGNEFFYVINFEYFKVAQEVVINAFNKIIQKEKL